MLTADWPYRSNHQMCSIKKGFLKNFAKITGKHLCQSLFFNKVAGLSPATLLKKRFWHRWFPVKFAKFLITPFFTEHLWWLLLEEVNSLKNQKTLLHLRFPTLRMYISDLKNLIGYDIHFNSIVYAHKLLYNFISWFLLSDWLWYLHQIMTVFLGLLCRKIAEIPCIVVLWL